MVCRIIVRYYCEMFCWREDVEIIVNHGSNVCVCDELVLEAW